MAFDSSLAEEDSLRAECYALLARLLAAPPGEDVLAIARTLGDDETEFGRGLSALAAAARETTAARVNDEYHALFIGIGRGELLPYGSYYLTGFLHEKPLALLRADMAALGVAPKANVSEPEDHIAALCEMMIGLITGAFGAPASLEAQRRFFDRHIGAWAPRFFEELETAKTASFYRPVGRIGRLFMEIEREAFALVG